MNKTVRAYVHYAITLFILLGPFVITNCPLLRTYFLFAVIIVLHWLTNGNECWISKVDYEGQRNAYTNSIAKNVGITLSETQSSFLNYGIMIFLISYMYFKIKRTCGFTL